MNPEAYKRVMRLPTSPQGGQELILGEVIASMWDLTYVWVPFPRECATLVSRLREHDFTVYTSDWEHPEPRGEVVYFGTPTIVDGKALFPHPDPWYVAKERRIVSGIATDCERFGYKRIVCGLGSGDISVYDRIHDIHGGDVVAMKQFDVFTDWVIVRHIKEAA